MNTRAIWSGQFRCNEIFDFLFFYTATYPAIELDLTLLCWTKRYLVSDPLTSALRESQMLLVV